MRLQFYLAFVSFLLGMIAAAEWARSYYVYDGVHLAGLGSAEK